MNRMVPTLPAGLLGLVLLTILVWQPNHSPVAQAQTQSALDPKGTLDRGPAARTASPPSDLASKKVLILHSFASGQAIYQIIDESLTQAFAFSGVDFNNLYFEYMDIPRNPSSEYKKSLSDFYRRKFKQHRIDLIIAIHTEALNFLQGDVGDLFPDVPIISVLANPNVLHSDLRRHVVALPVSVDAVSTVKEIVALKTDTQRLFVVSGSAAVDRRLENTVRAQLQGWRGGPDIEYVSDLPMAGLLKKLSHLPPQSAVLYITLYADSEGKTYQPAGAARMISASANVPVFGLFDTHLGDNGIVGGSLLDQRVTAQSVVLMAADILKGKLPTQPLTILPPSFVPMFDWLQLRRWGLNESALPADAVILNKPISTWERYKIYLLATMAFCLAETALIIFLIVQGRRKRVAEESQRKVEEKYRSIFEGALEGIFESSPQGNPLTANPALARILGYATPEEFLSLVHETAKQVWVNPNARAEYIRLLESVNTVHGYECQFWRKDRTKIWVSLSGQRVCGPEGRTLFYSGFIEDISERKRAEETLRDRLQFEHLLSGLSARFVNIPPDRVDSGIEDGLRQILEFFQVDRCALIRTLPGKTSYQITHVASSDNVPPFSAWGELPRSIYPWVYEKLTKKHEVVSVSRLDDLPAEANTDRQTCIEWGIRSFVNIPILIGESVDHIINVNSVKSERVWPEELFPRLRLLGEIFVNALERKRAEVEAVRSRAELLHVERSLRLNELTGSLAHELNQPLAAILSNAQAALRFLKSATPDLTEIQEILEDIISDDRRAGGVIRSVRSMMKREEGEKRPTYLDDLLNDVIQIFRSEAISRNVRIETECDRSLPPIFGDKAQLEQVLLNLIMNGAEAMAQKPSEQRKLILRTERKDQSVRVAVRDFGPGIDKDNLERVFQPFFTTKSVGLGIGLALCSSIIKAHRGRIWAENNPDGGATFIFELPIHQSGK